MIAVDTSVEPAVPGISSPPFDVATSPFPAVTSHPASVPPSSSLLPPFASSSLLPPWHHAEHPSLSVSSASQPPAGPCSPAPSVAVNVLEYATWVPITTAGSLTVRISHMLQIVEFETDFGHIPAGVVLPW